MAAEVVRFSLYGAGQLTDESRIWPTARRLLAAADRRYLLAVPWRKPMALGASGHGQLSETGVVAVTNPSTGRLIPRGSAVQEGLPMIPAVT